MDFSLNTTAVVLAATKKKKYFEKGYEEKICVHDHLQIWFNPLNGLTFIKGKDVTEGSFSLLKACFHDNNLSFTVIKKRQTKLKTDDDELSLYGTKV